MQQALAKMVVQGGTGTCTLVNRETGTFNCVDSQGDPHYAACQSIGGHGGGSLENGQGQFCQCGGTLASGSTDCKTFSQDYAQACVDSGGQFNGPVNGAGHVTCNYTNAQATCLGGGGLWNSNVNVCEAPAGNSAEQECTDGTTYGAPGIWNEPNSTCYRNPNHMDCELNQGMYYAPISDACYPTEEQACTADGGTWNNGICEPGGGGGNGVQQNAVHDLCTVGGQCSTTVAPAPPDGTCIDCLMLGGPPAGSFQFTDGNGNSHLCENLGNGISCTNQNTLLPTGSSDLPYSNTYTQGGPGMFTCNLPPNTVPGPGGCHDS